VTGPAEGRPVRLALAGLLVLAAALRLFRLTALDLWIDEGASVWFASLDLTGLMKILESEANPGLFYLLLKGWLCLGGSDLWVRLPAAGFGVLGVWTVFALGRRVFKSDAAGLVAGLLVALSPFQLHYSQEVRAYTIWFDLMALSLLFLWRWAESGRLAHLLGFAGAAGLSFYSHYSTVFYLPAYLLMALILARPDRRRLGQLLVAHLVLGLLCLPGLDHFWLNARQVVVNFSIRPLTVPALKHVLDHLVAVTPGWRIPTWPLLLALLALTPPRRSSLSLAILVVLPLGLMILASLTVKPIILPRVVLPSLVGTVLLWAGLWVEPGAFRRRAGRGLVGLVVLLSVLGTAAYFLHPDQPGAKYVSHWRAAVRTVEAGRRPGDAVVFAPSWMEFPYWWYERQMKLEPSPKWGFPLRIGRPPGPIHGLAADEAAWLERFWAGLPPAQRIWLIVHHWLLDRPPGPFLTSLAGRAELVRTWPLPHMELRLYRLKGPGQAPGLDRADRGR